ncbi:hypothetical protein IL306_006006 [Fusarium sp. DS 682]|nr:hypothetical protein IL306_006006 [Fusarium sp. DS 682]
MDFKTGQVGMRAEPFIQLVQPQVVEQWLREIGAPPVENRRDFVNDFSHEFKNSPQWEATFMWDCLYMYISEYENAQGNCVMTARTTWLDARLINRLGEKNANWQLKALLRQHLPKPTRYDRMPDPKKPYAMCYLAGGEKLVDGYLLVSELTALLVIVTDTALKATWQKQKIIPV